MKRMMAICLLLVLMLSAPACAAPASEPAPTGATTQPAELAATAEPTATPEPTPVPTPEPPVLLDHVVFTDPVLEERVRAAMGKPEGDISAADAAAVTELKLNAPESAADDQRIRDISALWYFMNLKELQFMGNAVTDISPLAKIYPNLEDKDFELK